MKKVLSILLLISMAAATGAYGACERCEWQNCNNNANWVVRKGRAATCWVARNVLRRKKHNEVEAVEAVEQQNDEENNNPCTSKKCPIHNRNKKSKNFCNQCGKYHR